LSGSLENVVSVAFSPDGKNLACGGGWGQGSILIWDLAKGDVLQTLPLGGKAKEAWSVLRAISNSPDGKRLAMTSRCAFGK
jgi:WD40 repeat protein